MIAAMKGDSASVGAGVGTHAHVIWRSTSGVSEARHRPTQRHAGLLAPRYERLVADEVDDLVELVVEPLARAFFLNAARSDGTLIPCTKP